MFLLGACSSESATEEAKVDKHQKALDAYTEVTTKYNNGVNAICDCIKEKGSKKDCSHLYNALSFDITEEMMDNLSDEELNTSQLVMDGNAKIDECVAATVIEVE